MHVASFVLIFWVCLQTQFGRCFEVNETTTVLIVNAVDGSLIGIDASNGKELWKIDDSPLISQSLSDLRLNTSTHEYSLVPSLDGQLYLLERCPHSDHCRPALKALPLTVESLFSSNFMLTEDSVLTGSKENTLFSFNPLNGKVNYKCSRDGCSGTSEPANFQDPGILVYTMTHIVRAVHVPTGSERWNVSIQNNELCAIHDQSASSHKGVPQSPGRCSTSQPAVTESIDMDAERDANSSALDIVAAADIEFDLERLLITGRFHPPAHDDRWRYYLPARIAKSWLFNARTKSLTPIYLFQRDSATKSFTEHLQGGHPNLSVPPNSVSRKSTVLSAYFNRRSKQPHQDPTAQSKFECPYRDRLVYLGTFKGQLYVQLEDGLDLPTPIQIDLPKVTVVSNPATDHAPSDSTDSSPKPDNMVGYYRAPYSAHPADDVCRQPFITDMDSGHNGERQTGLVPWFPKNQNQVPPYWTASLPKLLPTSPKEPDDKSDGLFSEWFISGARDLLMLLVRANQMSDEVAQQNTIFIIPHALNRFHHLLDILILVVLISFADRIFKMFHDSTEETETLISDPFVAPSPSEPQQSLPCPRCSASSTASCSLHSDTGSQPSPFSSNHVHPPSSPFHSVYETEFSFIRCLGRGGFGRVFEVQNRFDGCHYAIKRIEIDEKLEDKNKFLREVKALASLDHPGIVRYHRAWCETPPPGWQEARDQTMFGHSEDHTTDVDSLAYSSEQSMKLTASLSSFNGRANHTAIPTADSMQEVVTNGFDLSSDSIRAPSPPDDDSLIVFQRPEDTTATDTRAESQSLKRSIAGDVPLQSSSDQYGITYLYIQMQLCSPTSLRAWLLTKNQQKLRPPRPELYHMFRQITDAVAYLHENRLMHRDLKPSNILFDLTGKLKLADFGLVTSMFDEELYQRGDSVNGELSDSAALSTKPLDRSQRSSGSKNAKLTSTRGSQKFGHALYRYFQKHTNNVGTDLYMSPEQERGDPYDYKVDIFSLGLIFIELLIPFGTNMERIHTLTQAKLGRLPTSLTQHHSSESAFLLRLLDSLPSNRPSAPEILKSDLLSPVPVVKP